MGYDRECSEGLRDLAEDFGIENPGSIEDYLLGYKMLVKAKTLAFYAVDSANIDPESQALAFYLIGVDMHADPEDQELAKVIGELPEGLRITKDPK